MALEQYPQSHTHKVALWSIKPPSGSDDSCTRHLLTRRLFRSGLGIEDIDGPLIKRLRPLVRLADADDTKLAELRKRADEMEGDAFAGRSMKMQTVQCRDIDQVGGSETAIALTFKVIGGEIATRMAVRREELSACRIVAAVGEEVQHQKRVRRAPFPQVDLDSDMTPQIALFYRDEIDAEPAQRAFFGQKAGRCRPRS